MNLTSARRRLSQVGYFQKSATQVYTFCPYCPGRMGRWLRSLRTA